jgi:hypothetical protein
MVFGTDILAGLVSRGTDGKSISFYYEILKNVPG